MKIWIWIIMVMLLVTSVLADELQGFIDSPTTVSTACIRNGQMRTNVTVRVTIFDEQGLVIYGPVNSTPGTDGTFSTSYVFTQIGKYATKETCDFGDFLADGSTAITIIKPMFGNMQVIAQSIAQVGINKTAKGEWLLLLPNSTGAANSTITVNNGVCSIYDIDNAEVNATVDTVISNDKLTASFRTDPSYGFVVDENYQVMCDINLTGGLTVKGIKNYFYINPNPTYFQWLFSSISQLLGIAQDTQSKVNQTLSITNQTLQIVTGLNMTGGGSTTNITLSIKNDTQELLNIVKEEQMYIIG